MDIFNNDDTYIKPIPGNHHTRFKKGNKYYEHKNAQIVKAHTKSPFLANQAVYRHEIYKCLTREHIQKLIAKAFDVAMEGNVTMLIHLLDRLAGKVKDEVDVNVTKVSDEEVLARLDALLNITPLVDILEIKNAETDDKQ